LRELVCLFQFSSNHEYERNKDTPDQQRNSPAELLHLIPYKRLSRPTVKIPNRSRKHEYDDEAAIRRRRFVAERY